MTLYKWSKIAADNDDADATINAREGWAPSVVNNSFRAAMAALAKYRDDRSGVIATGGSASAYTVATNQVYAALADGITVSFRASATNSSGPTIDVDGLGAKPLRMFTTVALAAGRIVAGSVYSATYRLSTDEWLLNGADGAVSDLPATYAPINFTAPNTGGTARSVVGRIPEFGLSVADYGATPNSSLITSNHTSFNNAAYALSQLGGGRLYVTAGDWYLRQLVQVYSNIEVVVLPGATVIWDGANWSGDNFGFRNENHGESSFVDGNIHIRGPGILDALTGSLPGDFHQWYMRYVDNVTMDLITGKGGGNLVAYLACKDYKAHRSEAQNVLNCGFDAWDGAVDGIFDDCVVRGAAAQAFQATGTGTAFEDRNTWNHTTRNCRAYAVRGTGGGVGSATAFIFNVNDSGSTSARGLSMGNRAEDCDIGLAFSGPGGQHTSFCDTFKGVDYLPIFIQDASGAPSQCRIINPHLIDCDHDAGNIALIQMNGTGNTVSGLKITNSAGALYDLIAWFTSGSSGCKVELAAGAKGASGNFQNDGTNSDFIPYFPGKFTVAQLAARGVAFDMVGAVAYATDGRKAGEGAGAGTGVPVWWSGSNWLTAANATVTA